MRKDEMRTELGGREPTFYGMKGLLFGNIMRINVRLCQQKSGNLYRPLFPVHVIVSAINATELSLQFGSCYQTIFTDRLDSFVRGAADIEHRTPMPVTELLFLRGVTRTLYESLNTERAPV